MKRRDAGPPRFAAREVYGFAVLFAVLLVCLAGLAAFALRTMSAARAYVEGEGQWSKRQKEAVSLLIRYSSNRDEADYAAFREALSVPLGDRTARRELDRPKPDVELVTRGFLAGRNHPQDIPDMIWLYRQFGGYGPMGEAINLWRQGDHWIAELARAGAEMHRELNQPAPREDEILRLVKRVAEIDRQVSPLEDRFSQTLGEAARWSRRAIFGTLVGIAGLLILIAAAEARRVVRRLQASQAELLAEGVTLRETLDRSIDGVVGMDAAGLVTYWNPSAERMFGWLKAEATGRAVADLIVPERLRDEHRNGLARFNRSGSGPLVGASNEMTAVRRDGSEFPVELNVVALKRGHAFSFTAFIADLSARKQAEEVERELSARLYHQSRYDTLTDLPNRRLFEDRLTAALAQESRARRGVTVLFLDIDGFKTVNDTLGHRAGDRVLQLVARRLVDLLREGDTVARAGGDEFLVLLPQVTHPQDAARLGEKIVTALRPPMEIDGHQVSVTVSIGAAIHPHDGADVDTLVRCADVAMYRVKERGRNGYQLFAPEMHARASERLALEASLLEAVHDGQFVMHYQPVVDVAGAVRGAEALLRWLHPRRGLLQPSEFLAVAEATGLIVPIGHWSLYTACRELRRWVDMGFRDLVMSVNMSARQFVEGDLVSQASAALALHRLPPSQLEIEVTETLSLQNDEVTQGVLAGLRGLGVRLAIDDFGVGYSSLSYLRSLAPDTLKIDRAFIREMERDPVAETIAGAVTELGRSLGVRVVAEGVENEAQLAILDRFGCPLRQGYLFGLPMAAERFVEFLNR
jgi:diguanylate cyclase (GGDEF)-like protein/PAS domain S-box-containing protein